MNTPSTINILTGDTEFGETDPLTGVQVAAHIRTALAERPDDVGLVTWIYPFETYHRLAAADAAGQAEVFFGDWFVRGLINQGLPVATVGTPEAFDALLAARDVAPQTILLLPTAGVGRAEDAERLLSWLRYGVPAILYGPASSLHHAILERLGLAMTRPLSGELTLKRADGAVLGPLIHDPVGSGGGIAARPTGRSVRGESASLLYIVSAEEDERAYGASVSIAGCAPLYWLRGTNPFETRQDRSQFSHLPRPREAPYFDAGRLGSELLERLGYTIQVMPQAPGVSPGQQSALMLFSRHDNAWYLSGYAAQPVGSVRLRFPEGAPLFHATFTRLEGGASHYPLARAMRYECRVFVQQDHGVVGCDPAPRDPHHRELTLCVSGLQDATVVFLPPRGRAATFESRGQTIHFEAGQSHVMQSGLSGELLIRW